MKNSIFVIGGDLRLSYAAQSLMKAGYSTYHMGCIEMEEKSVQTLKEGIEKCDIILLGVPVSCDNISVNAPFYDDKILISDIAALAEDKKIIFGGKIPEGVFCGKVFDYALRDDFAMLNAVPTAEGALEIAMRETNITIAGSRVLVIGYGRIGKIVCKMFSGVGASVCATARKSYDIALINAYGYQSAKTADIEDIISGFDIIVNTVPERVISDEALLRLKKDALIIDTASKPGGLDIIRAQSLGVNVVWALSLPGKVAPCTSGKIICNTVINILKETGV